MSKNKEITDDHIYLLGSYISVLSTQFMLSNIKGGKLDVREFKQKTNKYLDYLEGKIYRIFKETYEMDEDFMEQQFNKIKTRNEFQVNEFLKEMCNEQ